MNFTIVGAGYVGLSLAVLISQKYHVNLIDTNERKISLIKKKKSPFCDKDIEEFFLKKKLKLKASLNAKEAYRNSDFVIVATSTNYDPIEASFNTSSVEKVIHEVLMENKNAFIIIKSTIPVGFTNKIRNKFNTDKVCFSPEFLREGTALYDNLYPSRIIVGDDSKHAKIFAEVLLECSNSTKRIQILFMESSEAEAVKLFSNTYLAMRISFFNELDSFSQTHKLSSMNIINGVSSDPRIGNYYNNPSFGYGGYCLPKDTKQLLNNFNKIPNNIIKAIIESNETRKKFIAETIIQSSPKSVGVYRLSMKSNSDNFRESAVFDVIKKLQEHKIKINLYEPQLEKGFENITLLNELDEFISKSDLIIANRLSKDLELVNDKVFSRDIFNEN
tara:strand:+ start:93 stop:1259 length:1167 start_codon:yes stop_codon:yes gene_type:complete